MNQKERIRKVLSSSNSTSYIAVLEQPEIDKVIADLVDWKNPLRQNMPRVKGDGKAYRCLRRTAVATTAAYWVAETTTTTATSYMADSSFALYEWLYQTLWAAGRVTRKYQAIGRSFKDILAEEIADRVKDFRNVEDHTMIAGSSTGTSLVPSTASYGLGLTGSIPSGLGESINMYNSASQQVYTEAASTTGGTSLTLTKLDELIDQCKGEPDALIMSKKSRRIVRALLQVSQRFVNTVEVKGGFQLMAYDNIPIFVSTNMSDAEYLQSDNSVETSQQSSEAASSSIYAVNWDEFFVAELTPVKIEPLAKVSTQYDGFEIYSDLVFVLRDPLACARLLGCME